MEWGAGDTTLADTGKYSRRVREKRSKLTEAALRPGTTFGKLLPELRSHIYRAGGDGGELCSLWTLLCLWPACSTAATLARYRVNLTVTQQKGPSTDRPALPALALASRVHTRTSLAFCWRSASGTPTRMPPDSSQLTAHASRLISPQCGGAGCGRAPSTSSAGTVGGCVVAAVRRAAAVAAPRWRRRRPPPTATTKQWAAAQWAAAGRS